MMELAAYSDLIQKRKNNPQSVKDVPLVQPGDTNTPALLRLLIQVATDDAEKYKRSYWAAQRNNLREWTSFAAIEDHDRDLLPHGDRTIELFSVTRCTSGKHESLRSTKQATVLLSHGWYPMPDEVKHDPKTLVASVEPCVMVRHRTVQEAFTTVLARSDSATNMCGKCAAEGAETIHFNQTSKNPTKTKYPFFLGFYSNQSTDKPELPMAAHFSFLLSKNVIYDLVAISFYNGKHYVANVRFGDTWFEYDGLVLPSPDIEHISYRPAPYYNTMRRLPEQKMYEEFSVGGYWPVFWKYCRKDPSNGADAARLHEPEGVREQSLQPQFNELARIQTS
jgi:hypothetical protein